MLEILAVHAPDQQRIKLDVTIHALDTAHAGSLSLTLFLWKFTENAIG